MITFEYNNGLPLEYESFLMNRYNSFISTCRYLEINYPDYNIYFMLVQDDGNLVDLLIFGNKRNTARCFNALVTIDPTIIFECTKLLFKTFPDIQKVMIDASFISYKLNKSILVKESEDYVLKLPSDINDYYKELGSSTRDNLKRRKNKLLRDFINVNYITKYNSDIEEKTIDKIVQLNYNRMKYKGVVPGIDEKCKDNIFKYSQHYGCVTYLELNGEIVAGCIASIINKDIFLHVYGHDNNYSKYNLGESCVSYLIQTSIENELSTFHLLWGKCEMKTRLRAKPQLLFSSYIYRAYSLGYITQRLKVSFFPIIKQFKLSAMSKPFRVVVKHYHKILK